MGTELGPPGAWLAGGEQGAFGVLPRSTIAAVALLVITAGAGAVAFRRGAIGASRLAVLVVALCALGVVATSRITGLVGTYLVRWWWVLAALLWLSIVWSATCAIGERGRHVLLGLAVVATAALSAVVTVRAVPAGVPDGDHSEVVGALAGELSSQLDRDAAYLVDWTDAELWGAVGIGVFVELERRGYDVSVLPPRASTFGRVAHGPPRGGGRHRARRRQHGCGTWRALHRPERSRRRGSMRSARRATRSTSAGSSSIAASPVAGRRSRCAAGAPGRWRGQTSVAASARIRASSAGRVNIGQCPESMST